MVNSDQSENMSKAKISKSRENQKQDRGDSVKIGTMRTPMPKSNLGNRCISAGKSFMEHLLIDSSQRTRQV